MARSTLPKTRKRTPKAPAKRQVRRKVAAKRRKVCVLTGGGDAPGLNAVIRGFVHAAEDLKLDVVASEDGFGSLLSAKEPLQTLDRAAVRGILPRGGTILGTSNRGNPFSRGKATLRKLKARIEAEGIDQLVLIGGDGTLTIGCQLAEAGIPVLGVPKTIDNDLRATDRSFGLDSAVSTATWAIDALHSTAESHRRVMILEVMGRHAGFIALQAGLAGGADVVLIPEIPYDIDRVVQRIQRRTRSGSRFSIIVVGEGAFPRGDSVKLIAPREGNTPARLGGAGAQLEVALRGRIKNDVRVTVLGHVQRGGSPCASDRVLSTRFGVRAAQLCAAGVNERMVALRGTDVIDVPLQEAIAAPHCVDPAGDLAQTARAIGIELGAAFRAT